MKVKTAILPVAGLGTRLLPLTLHQPKGMIGIVDRPMIHYAADEVLAAGINHVIIVAGPDQKDFKEYFDYLVRDPELEKLELKFDYIIQEKARGFGDAIYLARALLGQEPFLVCLSDDLLADKMPPMKTFLDLFEKTGQPMVALELVPKEKVSLYGVVKTQPFFVSPDLYEIKDVVEKPKAEEAPSNLAIIGRYIVTAPIMEELSKLYPYQGKEIGLAEALKNYVFAGGKLFGWHFRGKRFDAGSKIGILKAQVYFGLRHKDLGPELEKYLKEELETPAGKGEGYKN